MPPHDSIRSAYDLASEAYARKFLGELDYKPFDRELLQQFSTLVGANAPIIDLGCGPGHTTAYLTSLGLDATGVDLSPRMIELASRTFPQSRFEVGDFFALLFPSETFAGVSALYCVVHLTPAQLPDVFAEIFRVLKGGGFLLLSFHVGAEVIRAENFLETGTTLNFQLFEPQQVTSALTAVGFDSIDNRIRPPYATEHPTTRCYVLAQKPRTAS